MVRQNVIAAMRKKGVDLAGRWEEILRIVVEKTEFVPDTELLRKSEWWKTGKIGAVHMPGWFTQDSGRVRAVLKIQGTKPTTSEAIMIREFAKQNKSKRIRPPHLYTHLSWDSEKQFEALIMEEARGKPVVVNHPATGGELDMFFELYEEYRSKCRNKPWVARPTSGSYKKQYLLWRDTIKAQEKNDFLKQPEDEQIAEQAIRLIEKNIAIHDLEFAHGHFQPGDLIISSSGEVLLFSNLFWGWRNPFYDAVFGYHWWMLGMEHAENLTPELLEHERRRWLTKIYNLSEIKNNSTNKRWVTLALLERAVPALMVDRFMLDYTKPSAVIIVEGARRELKRLISELS